MWEFYKILQASIGLQLLKIHISNGEEEKLDSGGEPQTNWNAQGHTHLCLSLTASAFKIELHISCELHVHRI